MPVYKNLSKTKTEDQKKDDQKKKDDDEASKKRREEMDAEIQKKVAEFKEKIARAQLAQELAPPAVALPTSLGGAVPFLAAPAPQPPPPQPPPILQSPMPAPPPSNLSKDFQDALDIIFPSEVKKQAAEIVEQQGLLGPCPFPPFAMPPFPPLGLMQPQLPGMMMGFDMNHGLFPPRPQLYDTHVPIVPNQKPRQNKRPQHNKHNNNNKTNQNQAKNNNTNNIGTSSNNATTTDTTTTAFKPSEPVIKTEGNGDVVKKKEELDELALLGIDAGDVAGM